MLLIKKKSYHFKVNADDFVTTEWLFIFLCYMKTTECPNETTNKLPLWKKTLFMLYFELWSYHLDGHMCQALSNLSVPTLFFKDSLNRDQRFFVGAFYNKSGG